MKSVITKMKYKDYVNLATHLVKNASLAQLTLIAVDAIKILFSLISNV
jgi:hypothetical protein